MRVTKDGIYFWGSIFSNFFFMPIRYKGIKFPTTEHAFMWEKANYFDDKIIANMILDIPHPNGAKSLGREIKNYNDKEWSKVRYDYMLEVNRVKWKMLKDVLVLTENKIIVEASPTDRIWGVGLSQENPKILDQSNWLGENLLGKVIMQIRDELHKNVYFIDPLNT